MVALIVRHVSWVPDHLQTANGPIAPRILGSVAEYQILSFDVVLPALAEAWYELEGVRYVVNTCFSGDLRIAYISCNGEEEGDLDRDSSERNAMWLRLCKQHEDASFNLMLHGGDQLYADEVTKAHPLSEGWPKRVPDRLNDTQNNQLHAALERAFFDRYSTLYRHPEIAEMCARVPSLAMWDDHDICDGWGSMRDELLDTDVGKTLFHIARKNFLLFQAGAIEEYLPAIFPDRTGRSLTWRVDLPGATLLAPDLRSERRPQRVMGEGGWTILKQTFSEVSDRRLILLSSVPLLGPRLSIVEKLLSYTPWMEKYEDDLRDQWQSQAHREEWKEMLRALVKLQEAQNCDVTIVSGEIHLATRATMKTARDDIQQLVASGIAHPAPPRAYARVLGALARFGEAPLSSHPIRIMPLPGQPDLYTAERNYLVLERHMEQWTAAWELETSGRTSKLVI
jgi:PhoD related phosphatase